MFKKPKKNFRTRKQLDDSEEEEINAGNDVAPPVPVPPADTEPAKMKKSKKKEKTQPAPPGTSAGGMPKSSSKLSFEEEELCDSEVFQIKKSSHSRRIAKMLKREHKREQEEADRENEQTFPSSSVIYNEETLRELKEAQESQNGHTPVDMELGSDVEAEEKPTFDEDIKEEEEEEEDDPFKGPEFKNMIANGLIPDAATIHMARKRRQHAREKGGEDFIPIEDTKGKSRLVREEDHDHSEDEDGDRVDFSVDNREKARMQMQSRILEAEQGSHSEGDSEHEQEWESQQIRKGVFSGSANQEKTDDISKHYKQIFFGNLPPGQLSQLTSVRNTSNIVAARGTQPPKNLPLITVDHIKKRLRDRLEDITSVHRAHVHELHDIESRMDSCNLDLGGPSGNKGDQEEQYRFFQEMRGYVRDLVECLSEKMNSINYLDRCMMQLLKQRAEKIVKRRQQDIKDQSEEYMPNKAAVAQDLLINIESEAIAKQRRAAEREARRSRRRRGREFKNVSDHHDGLSTDDEENKSETTKFNTERDSIRSSVDTMFEDVLEDYTRLDLIKGRFEEWRKNHWDTYSEAYIGLCLPKLFTPFIKLQLIHWNPLNERCSNFESSPWFETLMFYGFDEGKKPEDPHDVNLMPSIIDKVMIAKLTILVEEVWDPLSTQETSRLVRLVSKLVNEYPTVTSQSKNTQGLLESVVKRMRRTLGDDVFIPLYPKQILENKSSGAAQFFQRQFWSCLKLLTNTMAWRGILSDVTLQQLGLDCLLNRYMVMALHNSTVNSDSVLKCQMISSVFPGSWYSPLKEESTIPQLEMFCRYLINSALTLEQTAQADKVGRSPAREDVRQIHKILVSIHALNHASALAEKHLFKS